MNIINSILDKNKLLSNSYYKLTNDINTDDIVGVAFLASLNYLKNKENTAVLAPNLYKAELIRDLVIDIVGEENVIYIPSEDLVNVDFLASSKDIKYTRIYALNELIYSNSPKIVIFNVSTAIRYFPNPELFKKNIIKIKINDEIDIDSLISKLIFLGYEQTKKVSNSGQFSKRGDIIDIFPLGSDKPIRIELFDVIVESIRRFNIETQESSESIDSILIYSLNEYMLNNEELKDINNKLNEKLKDDVKHEIIKNPNYIQNEIDLFQDNINNSSFYKYFSFLSKEHFSIFDYLHCKTLIFSQIEQCKLELNKLNEEGKEYVYSLIQDDKCLSDQNLFYDRFNLNFIDNIIRNDISSSNTLINIKSVNVLKPSFNSVINLIKYYQNSNYKIYLFFDSEQQMNFFKTSLLVEDKLKEINLSNIELINNHLSIGIDFAEAKIVFLSSKDIFGFNYSKSRYINKFKNASIIRNYNELQIGDYVVHEKYGIALYNGIKHIKANDIENDYMHLLFDGTDALYVPLEQFRYIRKYVGKEGYTPKLSKLNSTKWETTKKKVKEKINLLADKLAILYKNRQEVQGISFPADDMFQEEFENKFPYELTIDQKRAVDDIKKDMESNLPMDRLVCGDVGFGKTEVAFRSAFKAINSGKQVLLLCPTTILAKQHYERALERFSGFDVKICCLTRFTTNKEFKKALDEIKNGKMHFIIGTHKVLSNKITFNDLGLLIIDEEQRFGVEHKEKIKMLKTNIDVLTLSATPIPRTLQLSLIGMKSISIINTAPNDRMAIQTYLIKHDDKLIYELISRELGRNGQVYYVKNKIDSLPEIKFNIEQNIPHVRCDIINGQMNKEDIDIIMSNFYSGNIDVLITTTIVENGIDVARANLIIIEDANNYGLAQLYQLKGRVGRSNRLAYAYLTYHENKKIDDDAKKRLKSIQEFTELGSGYKIAQRDLMIRGAGDILGSEQAGFINDIGIDLYLKYLNEAIMLKEGKKLENEEIQSKKIAVSGYIPDRYAEESGKFEIYKWIDDCTCVDEVNKIENKIKDIYGRIPDEFKDVFKLKLIKLILLSEEFKDFNEDKNTFSIYLNELFNSYDSIGSKLFIRLMKFNKIIRISSFNQNIKISITKNEDYLDNIYSILNEIDKLYKECKENETR